MKNIFLYLILFFGLSSYFSTTSCNQHQFTHELEVLDSLSQKTISHLEELQAIDSAKVMEIAPLVASDLEWAKDSLSKEDIKNSSLYLSTLKSAKKMMEIFPKEYKTLEKELNTCTKQLNDLKEDLNNHAISKEEADRFVADESSALLIIEDHLNKLKGRINSIKDYTQIRDTFYLEAHARRNASSN